MRLTINGEAREVPEGLNVTSLLEHLGVAAGRVAVEVNTRVVKKADYAQTALQAGDQVEVVAFVGGG
jgi:thiamine biosynthesis protein ThiS